VTSAPRRKKKNLFISKDSRLFFESGARNAAKEKDKNGKLALHFAIENKAPFEVVSALLQAFPDAAKEKDKGSKLALHYAAIKQAPLEVVSALLQAFPAAVKEKDNNRDLPLHVAIENKAPLEVVSALLQAFPDAAKEKVYNHKLALHYAAEKKAPLEVVSALLQAFPAAAKEKDSYCTEGNRSVHWKYCRYITGVYFFYVSRTPLGARGRPGAGALPMILFNSSFLHSHSRNALCSSFVIRESGSRAPSLVFLPCADGFTLVLDWSLFASFGSKYSSTLLRTFGCNMTIEKARATKLSEFTITSAIPIEWGS
jgi:ankyrin repeat protein